MEDDERREAALASAAPLQPTFKPLGLSQHQLSKFQELHRRRLLIKSKSKNIDKSRAEKKGKCPRKTPDADIKNCTAANLCKSAVYIGAPSLENNKVDVNASPQSDNHSAHHLSKKQQKKLHWGLDTKERWEMKANM